MAEHIIAACAAPGVHEQRATDSAGIEQAQWITEQIASLANQTEEHCRLWHGEFDAEVDKRAMSELQHLRDVVCKLGWLADLAHEKIGGSLIVKGDAEAWMLPPAYRIAGKR